MYKERFFESPSELDAALAGQLAELISQGQIRHLLFSGGSTPVGLMNRLSELPGLDWSGLRVGLVDDRLVRPDDEHSNLKLLRRAFYERLAAGNRPELYALVEQTGDEAANLQAARSRTAQAGAPDAVLLGMGNDGHFASLFPGDPASAQALQIDCPELLTATRAPVYPQCRISHTLPALLRARFLFLHITGTAKLELLRQARPPLPIAALLAAGHTGLQLYWSP